MKKRLLRAAFAAALLAGAFALFSLSASAQQRTFLVRLPSGSIIKVTVDAPAGLPMSQVPGLPGTPISEITQGAPPPVGNGGGGGGGNGGGGGGGHDGSGGGGGGPSAHHSGKPSSHHGSKQGHSGSHDHATAPGDNTQPEVDGHTRTKGHGKRGRSHTPLRNSDGTPSTHNPTFFDALPAPSTATSVPNFVIRQFHVPIFLLPIYQAAGNQYGIRWEVLAAINEIETDYGRNLSVSTAGAVGWMQFLPSTWKTYGVDANGDKKRDPYNPVDAIFSAARYLKAAGGDKNVRKGIFAYNHAGWYVDSVMLRAKLISGVPGDVVGSLTGLTEGRFPVAAHAKYADDVAEQSLKARKVKAGGNAARLVQDTAGRKSIDIFAAEHSPVIAVNDGVVKKMGTAKNGQRFLVLQDVYGNRYQYAGLGSISSVYPVPKVNAKVTGIKAVAANAAAADPKPSAPASAGRQVSKPRRKAAAPKVVRRAPRAQVVVKPRIFAHPARRGPRQVGSLQQLYNEKTSAKGYARYGALFAHVLGLNAQNATLKPLRKGSHVIAGTQLGQVGKPDSKAAHINFQVRPAGKGAPEIDPKPILDGWKLLEATAVYRPNGKNALYGNGAFSIGQIMLLSKPMLEKRVLSDPRIEIYPGGRRDVKTGQIDRRVLATLEFLAESGLRPTVSCLKSGHSFLTTSGNVSEHSSGNAVDIAAINGIPILGHQDKGGITEQTVRRLMVLQGTMRPHQIISLLDLGANTMSLPDHANHIHVGFQPLFGSNKKLGKQTLTVLKPDQWTNLISRLKTLDNPTVPTRTSKFAIPVRRASDAHSGE